MVDVTYRGGGMDGVTSNAASEATLQRLVALMEKGSKGGGAATEKMANDVKTKGVAISKEDNKATAEGTEAKKDATKAQKKLSERVRNTAKAFDRYSLGLFSGIGNTIQTFGGLGKELIAGGNRISDFGQHVTGLISKFPIVGGVIGQFGQTMLNVLDNQIDMYRSLSGAGIDFGSSMFEMQRRAAEAGLNMATLAGTIQENSQMLAVAFGGATTGADRFSKISKYVQQSQTDFSKLGMTMEDVTEFTADYIDLQRIQGRLKDRSDRSLAKGTQNYIMQLDALAKITGMSRKQAAEELKAQSTDKRLQALFMNMDSSVQEQMNASLALIKGGSPEMEDAIKELIATNGAPLSDFGKSLLRTNPEFATMAQGLRDGSLSADDFAEMTNLQVEEAKRFVKENAAVIAQSQALGDTTYDAVLALAKMGEVGGKLSDAEQKQLDAIAAKDKTLTDFDSMIEKIRSTILVKLLDSGIFDKLQKVMSDLTAWFNKDETQTSIQGFVDRLGTLFDNLGTMVEDFKKDWGKLSIGELVTKYLINPIKTLFGADTGPPPGHPEHNKNAGSKSSGLMGGLFESLGPIIEKFESWGKALMWGGIGAAAVLIGFTAAVAAMAAPLALATPGVLAIGVAFAGVGVAGFGIAALIDSITTSVDNVAVGLKKFEDLDSKKLGDVGGALKPLTDNIMGLAKGGVVASFMSEGVLEKIAAGVKSFEGIDSKSMKDMGPALTSLQTGIAAFTGDGIMDSFSKFIGGLFGNDGGMKDMADDLEAFADIDSAGIKAIGDGLQGIAAYIETMDGANLKQVTKNLKELIKQIGQYNEEYKNMDAETKASFTKVLNVNNESQDKSSSLLNQLNSTNTLILDELKKQTKGGKAMTNAISGAA
jgi:hypothetical protein